MEPAISAPQLPLNVQMQLRFPHISRYSAFSSGRSSLVTIQKIQKYTMLQGSECKVHQGQKASCAWNNARLQQSIDG